MAYLDIEIKEDSPQKLAAVAGVPSKYLLPASEVNKVVAKINDLNSRISETSDKLVVDNGFSIDGTDFTLLANNVWELSGVIKSNDADVVKAIALATLGMKKRCIVLLDASNNFYLKYGAENAVSPPKPTKDTGTILLTDFTVTDSTVEEPTIPFIGDDFIKKSEQCEVGIYGDALVDFVTDELFGMYLLFATSLQRITFSNAFYGYRFFVQNPGGADRIIKHGYFVFPEGTDYVLKAGEIVEFYYVNGADFCWFLGSSLLDSYTKTETDIFLLSKQDSLNSTNFGSFISERVGKNTLIDADIFSIVDSATGLASKFSWLKLKEYFSSVFYSKADVDNKDYIKEKRVGTATKIWTGTQVNYDAIITKESNTLYFIK